MPANLTILKSDKFIGKRFELADGTITKRSETTFTRGEASAAYAPSAKALRAIIEDLGPGENLCLGVMRDGRDTARVVTSASYAKLKDRKDRIARTLDHFTHPDGPGWLVIDFDDAGMPDTVAQRLDALGGVEAALRHIWPEMADAEMLVRASSSSGVYAEGIDPKDSAGLHVYVLIRDPGNSKAALDALHRRAWAAGLGWIRPSANGKALVRSIVDVAVGSPERIVFEAPPELGEGVMRDAPPILTQAGKALAAPLDAPEVEALIEAEEDRIRPELDAIKAKYIQQRGKAVAEAKNLTVTEGEKVVREFLAQDGGKIDVPQGMLVYDRNGAAVTAEELVGSVKPGDQFGLPDPIEGPSYGRSTATLFWRKKYNAPILISHAHGMKTIYRLPEPPSTAVWARKAHRTPQDAKGRWTGHAALVTDKPAPSPDFVTVAEAGDRIRAAVRRFVEDKPAVLAIAASPGAGKSRHAREVLAEALPELEGDVAYYCPTLDLADEAAEHFRELGVPALAVRGRLATDVGREEKLTEHDEGLMCLRPKLVRNARAVGLAEGQNVCKRGHGLLEERCPHWDNCPWVQQWAVVEEPIVRCMAHNYLHLPDGSGRGAPALHVVDEACWQGSIDEGEVPLADWLTERSPQAFGTLDFWNFDEGAEKAANMLQAARDVLAVLQDGRDLFELSLTYTPEDFRNFAKAEATKPMLGPGPEAEDQVLAEKIAGLQTLDKHAGNRAAIWQVLADALEADRVNTERVLVRGDVLEVHWRREMPTGPTLHLDADADPVILGALYPEAAPEIVKAELHPRAEILQLTDKTFSKRALLGTAQKPAGAGLRKEVVQLVQAEVVRDRAHRGGGVLAVASKAVVAQIFEDAGLKAALGAKLHGAVWIWYGPASKGRNDWRDFGTVIELGREELPPSAIEAQARGLWGDGAEPLVLPEADDKGNVVVPEAVLPVLMADGSAMALEGRAYADDRLRALQLQSRENAGRQAAERLRMAHAVMPKRWVRLNNLPLPTAPVERLVAWAELVPDRLTAAVTEAALSKGFLRLNPRGLHKDAPGTFSSAKAAEQWLQSYTPHTLSKDSITGTGGIIALMRKKGQRGPTPTTVIIPAVTSLSAAKALLEQELEPLAHFEVLEIVPTPEDHAISETITRLESIAERVGYRPKVTVREVETPVFISGQFPPQRKVEALRGQGWPVELVPLE